jgi:hypothetical protein
VPAALPKKNTGRSEKAVVRAGEEREAGGQATAREAMGEQQIRKTLSESSQRRFREVLASRFARGHRVAWKKQRVHLARLRLWLWRLQLWLCQWSGFFEGAESILEKRLAKQLLLMDKRMNCP